MYLLYYFRTFKALIKLPRSTAIFEFSSSNGYSSFNLNFECRDIRIKDIGDENRSHFSYNVLVYDSEWFIHMYIDSRIETACEERGYELWNYIPRTDGLFRCYTTSLG